MPLKNTATRYGSIAKWFHWMTALLFLGSYVSVKYRHWFTEKDTPENWTALQLHLSIGITIAVLVVLRIIWRNMNRVPAPEPGTRLEHRAAHLGHIALYLMLIVMVVTGYTGTGVDTEFFFLFDITRFENTPLFTALVTEGLGLSFKEFEQPIDFIHKQLFGEWLAWMLVAGHFTAAMYHHFVRKDRTLHKMTDGD